MSVESSYEDRLKTLGIQVPPMPQPAGAYTPYRIEGRTAYLSGQISRGQDNRVLTGRVGADLSADEGKHAAYTAALNVLSVIRYGIGWDRFDKIVRVTGYVQTAPDFFAVPDVVNGASELFLLLFQEAGVHARSAVGVYTLPMNAAVELEVMVGIKDEYRNAT